MTDAEVAASMTEDIMASNADDAADQKALEQALGEPVPVEEPAKEEPVVDPTDPEAEGAVEEEKEDEQPDGEDTETDDSYDAAVEVLKRDGWTAEDLRKLSKARVQALAESAAQRQKDANTAWQKLQELEKAKETEAQKAEEAAPEPATETTASIAKAVETFKAEFGDEAGGTLQTVADALMAHVSTLLKPLDGLAGQVEAMQTAQFEAQLLEARTRVGERFPGLVDDAKFKADVMPHLTTLVATGKYQGKVDEALTDAAKLADLEPAESKSTKAKSKRSRGTSSTGTRQAKPTEMSEEDILDKAALASINGDYGQLKRMGLRVPAP